MTGVAIVTSSDRQGDVSYSLEGLWTANNASMLEAEITQAGFPGDEARKIRIDLAAIEHLDTYGAWLIERLKRKLSETGKRVDLTGISDRNRPLLDAVVETGSKHADSGYILQPVITPSWGGFRSDRILGENLSAFLTLFGASVASFARSLRHPKHFRLTSTIYQFDRVGWKALPIILLVTFIIGSIIAQQGFFHFRRFGADLYVVDMIGFLITREIGVLLVAIVVAGRSGSSFTAELGSMKMREEIDALRTMGHNPIDVLILPRILVLIAALPALAFIGSVAALTGAGIVAVVYAGMSPELFISRLNEAITMDHFLVGLIKAPFIGLVIGIIACSEGLRVKGSTISLGAHTTRSVVKSIFMVIVLDGLFAIFFTAIEM